jgi:hypothetical protein
MLTSPSAREMFDLSKEPPKLADEYGRTRFGQSCLLARRLVEAGVPYVQVNWSDHVEAEGTPATAGGTTTTATSRSCRTATPPGSTRR